MHTLARSPVREAGLKFKADTRAFTLIELLTVIGIIAILAAITFGVVKGVQERAAINQAKGELAAIAQALESYKRQYGDYPWTPGNPTPSSIPGSSASATDTPGILFNALAGKIGPSVVASNRVAINGKASTELAKFSLQIPNAFPATTGTVSVANAILDPWGRRYLYYYKTGTPAQWTAGGYILLSVGPSVATSGSPGITVSTDGTYSVNAADAVNEADNIYANQKLGN